MNSKLKISLGVMAAAAVCSMSVGAIAQTLAPPSYTAEQARRGGETYANECASCHGKHLDDGQFAVPLSGPAFKGHWGGGGLDGPFTVMTTMMPPSNPGGLGAPVYADVLAFILSNNGIAPSDRELPYDTDKLQGLAAPK